MKKSREVSLKDVLKDIPVEESLRSRLDHEFAIGMKTNVMTLVAFYNSTKWRVYDALEEMSRAGLVKKYKGNFNGKKTTIYERIK